jgi:hypothetical protein
MSWKSFSTEEQALIATASKEAGFHLDLPGQRLVELRCAHCGDLSLRTYLNARHEEGESSLLTQVWCSRCKRFAGSAGPFPDGLRFDDPLAGGRAALGAAQLFAVLDDLWAKGILPQTYQ